MCNLFDNASVGLLKALAGRHYVELFLISYIANNISVF